MKVRIIWPILFALTSTALLGAVLYQRSWILFYAEAEPLYPIVEEFGRELIDRKIGEQVSPSEIRDLINEPRYEAISRYGVVFSDDPALILSIRVNRRFTFEVPYEGAPNWLKTDH